MMKKFKELMRKPITWGDYCSYCFWCMIGYLALVAGFIGIGKWESRKAKKAKKEKKGYTTVKLDDIPKDPDESEIEEVLSWD